MSLRDLASSLTRADASRSPRDAEIGPPAGYSAAVATDTATEPLVTIERVHAAREVAGELGVDLLVLTPGSDLRYLCGYNAHAMERLTALAVPQRG